MEKDWTGSAMPSVLKGFTLIGQPIRAEEFKNAFGYDMPEITLTEEEKRRAALYNGMEPEIRQEKPEVIKTEPQPVPHFGKEVLARIQEGNRQTTEDPYSKPLEIEIRGVGNKQTEERNIETTDNETGIAQTGVRNNARNIDIPDKQNETGNRTVSPTGTESVPNGMPEKQSGEQTWLTQIGQNENHDNIAAQPDPTGQHQNAHEPIRQGINQAIRKIVRQGADNLKQQQETGNGNHLLNWAADVARQNNLQTPLTHPQQDYQPGYQAVLGHEANKKLAEAAAEPIETGINGKEKYQIVSDAFTNKYITGPKKLGYAIVSLVDHAIASANGGQSINQEITKNVDGSLIDLIRQSDRHEAASIPIEKLTKAIVAGDDAKTVDNLSQFGYELLGENGPIAAGSLTGGNLMAGAGMVGGTAAIVKNTKDFTVNLAEANAHIVNETGSHDWELAFKMAALSTTGGRAIENQVEKLKGSGNRGGPFIPMLIEALKKRYNSLVKDWVLDENKKRKDLDSD